MTTLLDEIQAKCPPELIADRQYRAIAALVSTGRTRAVETAVGNGTIIEVLGLETANNFLDAINTMPAFRHVKPLVQDGRLLVGSPVVAASMGAFVGGSILTQAQADALLALGRKPNPVSPQQVMHAMEQL